MLNSNGYNTQADFSDYLGNYRLLRLLGRGGFASVYLGEHHYLKRMAAIKVLQTIVAEQEKNHFLKEAQLLATLSHAHIVRVLEFAIAKKRTLIQNSVVTENIPFLVMEYMPGGNLRLSYPMGTRLFLDTVVMYINQIADALQYAHNQHIIHRDIKPENLLLNERQEVMLSDFGLALFTPASNLLSGQDTAGTVPYTAPEQLRGRPRFASDQYALGIIAYEWLSGYPPFRGSEVEIIMQHISSSPPRLCPQVPSLPQAVEEVVLKALAKDPAQRYHTIQDFARALTEASKKPQLYNIAVPKKNETSPENFPFFYYLSQQPLALSNGVAGNAPSSPPAPAPARLKRQGPLQGTMTPSKRRNRQRMIQKVRTFWIKGVLEPSLQNHGFITPELRERQDALATPWPAMLNQAQKRTAQFSPTVSIIEAYDQADGELLILGEGGSGKTTLLLQLTRTLLDRAEEDASAPIPVVFLLSSWSAQQLPIEQWLIKELQEKYQVPAPLGALWFKSDILLPLLDGLDEVATYARSACVTAINVYKQEHGLSPLVVCSRLTEYLLFPPRVLLQRAVVVQSLSMRQISDYFHNAGEKFQIIYQILCSDPLLQRIITTPLMLNIMTIAYQNKAPAELLKAQSSTERYQHILQTYVEQMLQRHPDQVGRTSYTPQQLMFWLSSLARKMRQHQQVVFYIEQLQPTWIDHPQWRQFYAWLAVLLPGALIGGLTGLLSNDIFFHAGDFKSILLDGLYGVLMGSLFSGTALTQVVPKKQFFRYPTPQKARGTGRVLLTSIFLGLLAILFLGISKGWPDGLLNGTFLGLMCFPMSMLIQKKAAARNRQTSTVRKQGPSFVPFSHPFFTHITNGLIIGPICGISNVLTNIIRQGFAHYSLPFYVTLGIRETLHNFLLGTLVSLLLFSLNDGTIHRAEIIVWSWKRFWNSFRIPKNTLIGVAIGLIVGLTYGLKETFGGSVTNGLSDGLSDTLLLTGGYSLVCAFLQGFSSYNLANHHRYTPNEGIRRSVFHSLIGGLIGAFIGVFGYILSNVLVSTIIGAFTSLQAGSAGNGLKDGIISGFHQGILVDGYNVLFLGLASGLLFGLLLGGLAALQHGTLRFILWKTKVLPLNLAYFLDYATKSILLHKVGGGFMFIHRFLLDYFLSLQPRNHEKKDDEETAPGSERLVRLL